MKLHDIAHARTGDKGDVSNISVISYDPAHWSLIRDHVTPARVAAHFGVFATDDVTRYALPQLCALNFVIRGALNALGVLIYPVVAAWLLLKPSRPRYMPAGQGSRAPGYES